LHPPPNLLPVADCNLTIELQTFDGRSLPVSLARCGAGLMRRNVRAFRWPLDTGEAFEEAFLLPGCAQDMCDRPTFLHAIAFFPQLHFPRLPASRRFCASQRKTGSSTRSWWRQHEPVVASPRYPSGNCRTQRTRAARSQADPQTERCCWHQAMMNEWFAGCAEYGTGRHLGWHLPLIVRGELSFRFLPLKILASLVGGL